MARRKWNELDPRTRRLIIITGALEGAFKIAALIDLARRVGLKNLSPALVRQRAGIR